MTFSAPSRLVLASLAALPLLCSCGDSDEEREERAARFTTSTRPAPNPQRVSLSSLVRTDRHAPTALPGSPRFKLYSEYAGEDIRQVTGVSGRTLLLCFTAPWCPHSNRMKKALQEFAQQEKGTVQVVVINADEYPMLAKQYQLTKVPTTFLYTEGVRLRELEGRQEPAGIAEFLNKTLSQDGGSN